MSDPMNQSTDSRLIAGSKVEGRPVFDTAGDRLGTVKEIYLDKKSGKAEYAAMAFGGALGIGEKYHPLPWRALDYDPGKGGFVVSLDKRQLEGSPAYDETRLGRDYGWDAEVRDYYRTALPGDGL